VILPDELGGSFTMRFVPHVDKHGTHELPEMFYEGVMFGVSSMNSHKVEVGILFAEVVLQFSVPLSCGKICTVFKAAARPYLKSAVRRVGGYETGAYTRYAQVFICVDLL
jgi:hypothetical protein